MQPIDNEQYEYMQLPNPLRLVWRELIQRTLREIVRQPELVPAAVIQQAVGSLATAERESVQALLFDELGRLHTGTLARCKLTLAEFEIWAARHRPEEKTP